MISARPSPQLLQDWNETLCLKEVSSFLNKKLSLFLSEVDERIIIEKLLIKNVMSAMMQNLLEKFLFRIINFIERYNRLRVSTIRKSLASVFYWLFLDKDVYIISYLLFKYRVVYAFYISEFNYDWNHSRPEQSTAIGINLVDIFALLTDD